jgi:cyclopropane-fatty-acyl-phospholipid synthase
MAWHQRFEATWPQFRERYGDRFHRIWRYYLLACAGSFRARSNQLWQVVLSPVGVGGGYRRPLM